MAPLKYKGLRKSRRSCAQDAAKQQLAQEVGCPLRPTDCARCDALGALLCAQRYCQLLP